MNRFERTLARHLPGPLRAEGIGTLQVNVGLECNQACVHCHLSASPAREERMSWETMQQVVRAAGILRPRLVDITGGAPEIHPHFPRFVGALVGGGHAVQVRTNLTALVDPASGELAEFLRRSRVALVGSLPCYLEENVDAQRGGGVHARSIEAIRLLNLRGYGISPDLPLHLVYNPGGPKLPPAQAELEADYRRELRARWGISFTRLLSITNMPIGRFLVRLRAEDRESEYRRLLESSFNPATVAGLMCRSQMSVGWDGTIYDCDFNLALGLPVDAGAPSRLGDFDPDRLGTRTIVTGEHCFGCTAGHGSSCAGALA